MPLNARRLAAIRDRKSLFKFLDEELGWPLGEDDFVYDAHELDGASLKEIVPFTSGDPYAIFLLESGESVRKETVRKAAKLVRREVRKHGKYDGKEITDMVFLCTGRDYAEIRFVKFVDRGSRQARLSSFGWDAKTVAIKRNNTIFKNNLPALRLDTEDGLPRWETARWSRAWDTEPVTKAFYTQFESDRQAFLEHLPKEFATEKRHWMASLVLNRLLFVWFLADGNRIEGLKDEMLKALEAGSFYREFFLPLCLCALGAPQGTRGRWESRFSFVPYLNGGLFERHEIERELGVTAEATPGRTDFSDDLFARLLREPKDGDEGGLFRRFNWTLDEQGEEATSLSPHVLGYVFERHINGLDPNQEGQKKAGAYYTKEDITGYIARSTIIPRLLDKLDERLPGRGAFNLAHLSPEGTIRYVFPSVKQPRKLPTETDYEQQRRFARLEELRCTSPSSVDEFVTLNLNLALLVEDFVSRTQDPEVLWAFYQGLREITVLDPTVGSGAFLLAALEVLAPIHRACLVRMEAMVRDSPGEDPVTNLAGEFQFEELIGQGILAEVSEPVVVGKMRAELERVRAHGRAEAYLRKGIVLDNLYGVDLMPEAVEICRLRLYLAILGGGGTELEPLPDLSFNIVSGNTLVGYPNIAGMDHLPVALAAEGILPERRDRARLKSDVAEFGKGVAAWRKREVEGTQGIGPTKNQLREAAERIFPGVTRELYDLLLASKKIADVPVTGQNGKPVLKTDGKPKMRQPEADEWAADNRPLHWFLAFPTVEAQNGFDVVVGNPPWVETSTLKGRYAFAGYRTLKTGNLYALVTERVFAVLAKTGRFSFIVQLPIVCADRMAPARELLRHESNSLLVATFDDRPGKLFEGLEHCRSTIFILRRGTGGPLFTTRYHRWATEFRSHLVESLEFAQAPERRFFLGAFPKSASATASKIFEKLLHHQGHCLTSGHRSTAKHIVFYQRSVQYWIKSCVGYPRYRRNGVPMAPPNGRILGFSDKDQALRVAAVLNSSLFYMYYIATYDCLHTDEVLLDAFPMPERVNTDERLAELGSALMKDLEHHSEMQEITTHAKDVIEYQAFFARKSKHIIDKIDQVLAHHYGLTEEELNFVFNYDIKYRMGRDADDES